MGIGFGGEVELVGVWVAAQWSEPVWAEAVRAVGYRDGEVVASTEWFEDVDPEPSWFEIDLAGIDRVVFEARSARGGAAFYGIDDLTFVRAGDEVERRVLDFDDLHWRFELTGSDYGGLTWEEGTGSFDEDGVVHAPLAPPGLEEGEVDSHEGVAGGAGTAPDLLQSFVGPFLGDPGAGWLPPDTCGAVGIDHFVSVVNKHMSVYRKSDGVRVISTSLGSFWGDNSAGGDPRIVFDEYSQKFFAVASDFTNGLHFAMSMTADPTGAWFKSYIDITYGVDANTWPDYETLGVDERGVYTAAYMVGGNFNMAIFAIDKAPLVDGSPNFGTITAWNDLPWEGAIQPCVTHGPAPAQYLVSRANAARLRLRRIDPPLTSPTLVEVGAPVVPNHGSAPPAPALGSTVPLSTVDYRPMNAEYRAGSVWTAHNIAVDGRAACRWYEIDASDGSTIQYGTVADPVIHYFFPAVAVNARGDVVLGCSASHEGMYAGAYYTGRRANDPPGEMAVPRSLHDGEGPYNFSSSGTNRWGDYSLTTIDPVDDLSFWTIQEYARAGNNWGTWIGKLWYDPCLGASNYCVTSVNSVGLGAEMYPGGSTSIAANDFSLLTVGCPTNQFGIYFFGPDQTATFLGDGVLCVAGSIVRYSPQVTDGFGSAQFDLDVNAPPAAGLIVSGTTWNFQFWYRDPAFGGLGSNLSDAVEATVPAARARSGGAIGSGAGDPAARPRWLPGLPARLDRRDRRRVARPQHPRRAAAPRPRRAAAGAAAGAVRDVLHQVARLDHAHAGVRDLRIAV